MVIIAKYTTVTIGHTGDHLCDVVAGEVVMVIVMVMAKSGPDVAPNPMYLIVPKLRAW